MQFQVNILGCGAATPTQRHFPTSQLVNMHDKYFLIDCGEGTQMQLRKFKLKMQRIQAIFISHLHGDHFFGLIGLLSSYNLLGRTAPLKIYAHHALESIIRMQFEVSEARFEYEIEFISTQCDSKQLLYEDETLQVFSFPLKHRVPCTGFLFEEKPRPLNVIKSAIREYQLVPSEILQLKKGLSIRSGAEEISAKQVTDPAVPVRKYAYCSDTAYDERIIPHIQGADVLYHESTFLNSEQERAKKTQHSTAEEAAKIARKADVKKLILGHYSSRYSNENQFLEEATPIYQPVELANEGMVIQL
jgi:ribonuclease Z